MDPLFQPHDDKPGESEPTTTPQSENTPIDPQQPLGQLNGGTVQSHDAAPSDLVDHLDPHEHERILDIGCGDGTLTATIAPRCKYVLGLDVSKSEIDIANRTVKRHVPNIYFMEQDCCRLEQRFNDAFPAHFDKILSNKALHCILPNRAFLLSFSRKAYQLLKGGGSLVLTMPGAGHVDEIYIALQSILYQEHGSSVPAIRACKPWYLPTHAEMRSTLEDAGFYVEICQNEQRPFRLTELAANGTGGPSGLVTSERSPLAEIVTQRKPG